MTPTPPGTRREAPSRAVAPSVVAHDFEQPRAAVEARPAADCRDRALPPGGGAAPFNKRKSWRRPFSTSGEFKQKKWIS